MLTRPCLRERVHIIINRHSNSVSPPEIRALVCKRSLKPTVNEDLCVQCPNFELRKHENYYRHPLRISMYINVKIEEH